MEKKQILLTGASGTIGSEVVKLLLENPSIKLVLFDVDSKANRKFYKSLGNRVQRITGSLDKLEDIKKIPSGLNAVIHLAAIIPPLADEQPELTRKVNVEGTLMLIEHLEETSPEAFFLYSSSVSVYGDRLKNPDIYVTDNLSPSVGDLYGKSKVATERIIQNSSLKWSIFRLAAIMKNHKISKLMFEMPLETQLEICTPEDTALAFVNALSKQEQLRNRVFNLGGGPQCTLTYQEFLDRSFRIFGLGGMTLPESAFATSNYHCGRMADGHELEEILHFRNDTLESYFERTKKSVPIFTRLMATLFRPIIKRTILNMSEYYKPDKKMKTSLIPAKYPARN